MNSGFPGRGLAVGHGKTAVGCCNEQRRSGSGPETAAQQRVVPFEEQDVAQVHERIVRDADRFDMVAPLFDEFLLFPQVILSHGRAVVGDRRLGPAASV